MLTSLPDFERQCRSAQCRVDEPSFVLDPRRGFPMSKVTVPFAAVLMLAWILTITVINASAH
ncbi:hypothetical protein GCM10009539_45360 [Cryptosporangium japonicum]|uniref:Uncharacterized protein n=1 Tax=Cryptosporangium japonicum TaxID=80872 RepID=A0ABP3E7P2_9ACTN